MSDILQQTYTLLRERERDERERERFTPRGGYLQGGGGRKGVCARARCARLWVGGGGGGRSRLGPVGRESGGEAPRSAVGASRCLQRLECQVGPRTPHTHTPHTQHTHTHSTAKGSAAAAAMSREQHPPYPSRQQVLLLYENNRRQQYEPTPCVHRVAVPAHRRGVCVCVCCVCGIHSKQGGRDARTWGGR